MADDIVLPSPPPAPPVSIAPPSAAPAAAQPQPASWEDIIGGIAKKYQVDPRLALAVAKTESSLNPTAVSPTGARGLMQLMPATAARWKVNPDDPIDNITGGVQELRSLLDQHNGDVVMALRRYNASPTAADSVTDPYVQRVLGQLKPSAPAAAAPATAAAATSTTLPPLKPKAGAWATEALTPPAATAGPPPAPGWWQSTKDFADEATKGVRAIPGMLKSVNDAATRMIAHNPGSASAAAQEVIDSARAANTAIQHAFWNPGDTASKVFPEAEKARQAFDQGDYLHAALEAKNVPLDVVGVGQRLSDAEEHMRRGEIAKGLGATADVGATIAAPELIGEHGVPLLGRAFKPRLTAPEAAAVEAGFAHGIPVDAATASGSKVARNIQASAEATPFGGAVHEGVRAIRQGGLRDWAENLATGVHPTAVSPAEAGERLRAAAPDFASAKQAEASAAYNVVDQHASAPANRRLVQTGTTPPPFLTPGAPPSPVMEMMNAPVDLRQVKATLAPVRDAIKAQMPLGQQQYSKGLLALDNVLNLRDFEPVSVADKNLGAIKRVARGAENPAFRSVEEGTASLAVRQLSDAVDTTMAQLGPRATQALNRGRAATKAKWAVEDLASQMDREPVAAFNLATGAGDLHAEALTELQRVAPQEMPRVGRAVLEKIFQHAGGLEQGWSREAGVARMWENLGPQTKQILFGGKTQDLDQFFLLQKMLAQQANPSRTALVHTTVGSSLTSGGALATGHPVWAFMSLAGPGGVALLMNTQAGVRLLTQGLRIPAGDTARAAAWTATAMNQLHRAGATHDVGTPPPAPVLNTATPPPPPPQ